jgi:hypothetical protein
MRGRHRTPESARAVVEPFLRVWELEAALFSAQDGFEFEYQNAEMERPPSSTNSDVLTGTGTFIISGQKVTLSKSTNRANYPNPPVGLAWNSDVEVLRLCYRQYFDDRRRLGDAAYFCLTVLERAAGDRAKAAIRFHVASAVLNKIGMLTDQKGGNEARKAKGAQNEFTNEERGWLEAAMKNIMRRVAQVAHDPNASYPQLTMADLPPIN